MAEHWLRFNYDADGSIGRIFSSAGRYVDIVRDRSMKIIGARDDAGRSTRYTYDAMGALAESLDIGGGVTRYRYDDQGFLSSPESAATHPTAQGHQLDDLQPNRRLTLQK